MATQGDAGHEPDRDPEVQLGVAIAVLFAGPLTEFVAGRDALVRALRSEGRMDDVAEVRALRKPKAVARALNAGAAADPAAVSDLVAAVGAAGEAQNGGGDVRAALADVRDAEQALTQAAVAAVAADERPPDASTLGAAVRAVLADPDALTALRAGRLVDVPTGGGFGLAGLTRGTGDAPAKRVSDPRPGIPRSRKRPARTTADDGGNLPRTEAPAATARTAPPASKPARVEPKALVAARRAVADAEAALRAASEAVDEAKADVARTEADEDAARDAAADAARRADEARARALEVSRIATAARREAATRIRRRAAAEAALAKADAKLAKLTDI